MELPPAEQQEQRTPPPPRAELQTPLSPPPSQPAATQSQPTPPRQPAPRALQLSTRQHQLLLEAHQQTCQEQLALALRSGITEEGQQLLGRLHAEFEAALKLVLPATSADVAEQEREATAKALEQELLARKRLLQDRLDRFQSVRLRRGGEGGHEGRESDSHLELFTFS